MQENTTSRMISDIRLPLAVMVVFIHSFGSPTEYDINWSDIGGMDVYNMVRVLCSHVISHIAVPAFYVISGYLFFIKAERLDWSFYKKQWTKRVRTLLVPYILWNVIQALFLLSKMVLGVLINGNPIERLSSFTDGILSPAVLWDYHSWGGGTHNVLQQVLDPNTAPILIPLYFIRNLICVVLAAPILAWLIRKTRGVIIICFLLIYLLMIQTPVPTGAIITCTFFSIGAWFGIRKQSLADLLAPKAIPLFLIWLPLIVYNVYWDGNRTDEGLILYPLMVMVGVFCIIALTARCLDGGQRRYSNHNRQSSHHTNRLKSQWSKLHDYAARNTFFIFAAHHCFGILLASVITNRLFALSSPEVCYTPWFWTLIYIAKPFLIIAICLAVLYVFQRFTPRLAGWLAGGR